jgi:acyl dehydratase
MASILDRAERNAMAINASMPRAVAHGIEGLQELKDEVVGPSEWREVTQEMVDRFAELTGDDQWIHTDVERAKSDSPYGTTIAHGNLTLSLIDGLRRDLTDWSGFVMGVNYGWGKVRFPAPVPVGSRVRCYAQLVEVSEVGGGWYQAVTRFTVEIEGGEKPVCVADSVGRLLVAG